MTNENNKNQTYMLVADHIIFGELGKVFSPARYWPQLRSAVDINAVCLLALWVA